MRTRRSALRWLVVPALALALTFGTGLAVDPPAASAQSSGYCPTPFYTGYYSGCGNFQHYGYPYYTGSGYSMYPQYTGSSYYGYPYYSYTYDYPFGQPYSNYFGSSYYNYPYSSYYGGFYGSGDPGYGGYYGMGYGGYPGYGGYGYGGYYGGYGFPY
jgi:hypothetical protein